MKKLILLLILRTSITFVTASLPDGRVGKPYSKEISVAHFKGACIFTTYHGALPPGLAIMPDTTRCFVTVLGMPKKAGDYEFSLRVEDTEKQMEGRGFEIKVTK